MSYRKVVNQLVFVISILLVNLITTLITDFGLHYLRNYNPVKATLIGMGACIFILYPAYTYIDNFSEKLAKQFFSAGKNAIGKFLGLILAFMALLGLLFMDYLKVWFNVWFWQINWQTTLLF